ncbi:MAG: SlyX family protein [Parvibaculaceae bacterium]|nr:SlyX family protein [Parvibaculaceae bacterium]
MTDTAKLEERITNLEMHLAHQNETIETLNQTVTAQWAEIERFTLTLRKLNGQIEQLEDTRPAGPDHQLPPHY